MAARIVCSLLVIAVTGCGEGAVDTGPVTRSSLDSLEEGGRLMKSGDCAAAREAFAAAATGGGLQPDFYCEARLQQAWCAARLGDRVEALAILDELAAGAPDLERIERMRTLIRSQPHGSTAPATAPVEAEEMKPETQSADGS